MMLKIGVTRERAQGEKRVALTPECVKLLSEKGFGFLVESGAGTSAGFSDKEFEDAGAAPHPQAAVIAESDVLLRVMGPTDQDLDDPAFSLGRGKALISFLFPTTNPKAAGKLADRGISTFAMDLIPRITRAQSMDALSSMSTIAGYKGALLAANHLPKFFPMLMTAAGTIPPARAFIIGAGVAGLQAIATCKRLGAIVEAFDVRPAVKEQVESLGGRFVALDLPKEDTEDTGGYAKEVSEDTHKRELELIGTRMAKADIVITTALIPGRPAPKLITREMVDRMAKGSVIVDLAATNGGNCEATVPGKDVDANGVTVLGPLSLLSDMAGDASRMYSKNIMEFLLNLAPEGELKLDLEDQIINETLVTRDGQVHHEPTRLIAGSEVQK